MNSHVVIKSIPNGLKLQLDSNCDFAQLIEEVGTKFRESGNFFKGSRLAVFFVGRALTDVEEKTLVETMEKNGDFSVLYIIGSEDSDRPVSKAVLKETKSPEEINGFGKVYRGNIRHGETVEFPYGVIIMGDVEPNAHVKANGNVIVMGGLYGSISIQSNENAGFYITALEFSPERIKIGELRYYSNEKSKWSIRPKYQPKIAYVKDNEVLVDIINQDTYRKIF